MGATTSGYSAQPATRRCYSSAATRRATARSSCVLVGRLQLGLLVVLQQLLLFRREEDTSTACSAARRRRAALATSRPRSYETACNDLRRPRLQLLRTGQHAGLRHLHAGLRELCLVASTSAPRQQSYTSPISSQAMRDADPSRPGRATSGSDPGSRPLRCGPGNPAPAPPAPAVSKHAGGSCSGPGDLPPSASDHRSENAIELSQRDDPTPLGATRQNVLALRRTFFRGAMVAGRAWLYRIGLFPLTISIEGPVNLPEQGGGAANLATRPAP